MPRPENLEAILSSMEAQTMEVFRHYSTYSPFQKEFLRVWEDYKRELLEMDWDGPGAMLADAPISSPRTMTPPKDAWNDFYQGDSICNCCGSSYITLGMTPVDGKISFSLGDKDPKAQVFVDGVNFYFSEE